MLSILPVQLIRRYVIFYLLCDLHYWLIFVLKYSVIGAGDTAASPIAKFLLSKID